MPTQWYTVAKLSDHMEFTPEGFLLVKDVPIARCGVQLYRGHEIPELDANDDGWIEVDREPSEVFKPQSMASFTGKPIVNDHPWQMVGPSNYSDLAIGAVHNIRRGENTDHDLLLADLLFTTDKGIELVRSGKRALSVGYNAYYGRTGRGLGRQYDIVCNHVALVDEGRCGARCTIIDGAPIYNHDAAGALNEAEEEATEDVADIDYADADIDWPDAAGFIESEHPRDDEGKFTEGSGGGGGSQTFGRKGTANLPASLHGVKFEKFEPPSHPIGWTGMAAIGPDFHEPPMPKPPPGKKLGAGVIIKEPDGRVWVVHPKGGYGGYNATFPKGTVDPGEDPRATAIREAYEESGLHVELTGHAGDVERDTSLARYYHARRIGGTPEAHGWETEAVTLAPADELHQHLNRKVDRQMVESFIKPKPAPTTSHAAPADTSKWKKVGGQLGSNPGAQMEDETGAKHYVKFSKSEAHARNEVLAGRLYEAAGAPVLHSELVDTGNGKVGTATRWAHELKLIDRKDAEQRREAQQHFATHAWLANWDAAGLEYDNQGRVGGKMTTLDPGGSLIFRAQGTPKGAAFGHKAGEWDTLRDPSNHQAHRIFGEMSNAQLSASAAKVANIPDATIRHLVMEHGPGTEEQRTSLAEKLINRKRDIASRGGVKAADRKPRLPRWLHVHWHRDEWVEGDHPRAPAGSSAGGQFTSGGGGGGTAGYAASVPSPTAKVVQGHGPSKALGAKVKQALQSGEGLEALKAEIKEYHNKYVNAGYKTYAKALLSHIGAAEAAAAKAPQPAAAPAAPAATGGWPEPKTALQTSLLEFSKDPDTPLEKKLEGLQAVLSHSTIPEKTAFVQQLVAKLKGQQSAGQEQSNEASAKEAEEKAAAEEHKKKHAELVAKGPKPHAGSKGQQQIYQIATSGEDPLSAMTPEKKIQGIQQVMNDPAVSGPYTKQFGEEWIKALGGAPPAAPTPAAPKPKPGPGSLSAQLKAAAPKTAKHGSLTAPPSAQVTQAREGPDLHYALKTEAEAADPASTQSTESFEIVPSLKPEFWQKPKSKKDSAAFDSYGGGGYHGINGVLRGNQDPSPSELDKIDAMKAMFRDDDVQITKDIRLVRGEEMNSAQIAQIQQALQKGVGTHHYMRTGFTSASIGKTPGYKADANVWWHFAVKKGQKVLGIAGHVGHHEREVVLPHGVSTEIYEMYHDGQRYHIKALVG